MKKLTFSLMFIALFGGNLIAQGESQYKKMFYQDITLENDDYTILIENAVAGPEETKFKFKITNKSDNFIIFKPDESKLVINGKEIKPNEKQLMIAPGKSWFRVINIKQVGLMVNEYSYLVEGLYKITSDGPAIPAPDFILPPSQNDFKAGEFNCTLAKLKKETNETEAKFKCIYKGNKVGFIDPSRMAVRMPDGKEYASSSGKDKSMLFFKGEEDDFTVQWDRMQGGKATDMQKVEMIVLWRDAFKEGEMVKLKSEKFDLKLDQALTEAKGK